MIDDDLATIDVYIQPPLLGAGDDTDGDSGEEDCNDPNRLCCRQLEAPAEIVIHTTQGENTISLNL